ncbi:hypothetical protein FK178_09040 [Antarcticibacterium arcticum]|uniref:Alpha/beta hydrolase n=1 Tax=Antarcticibacterium arcticum TaxID=2585771 RepID=A0A5B8YPP0_9FLAO|nr:YqiA/YcfP family alpha/beta fold hydrolase [Antarcticibacterium arcticum]QED37859.1 hypothetical protein FK178_09040 [Antarcticibacterium arcticum]
MNIVYIHGLDSKLSNDKKEILQKFGNVIAPEVDYYSNANAIESLIEKLKNEEVQVIIGSSMGGFAAYYISTALQKPALLFNPALKNRSVEQIIPSVPISAPCFKQFVLGNLDDVVNPGDTLAFISKTFNEFTEFQIHLRRGLTHNIPLDVLEEEVSSFLNNAGLDY